MYLYNKIKICELLEKPLFIGAPFDFNIPYKCYYYGYHGSYIRYSAICLNIFHDPWVVGPYGDSNRYYYLNNPKYY